MRKSLALIMSLLLLSFMLCGCGCDNGKTVEDKITEMPAASPDMSPIPSPDTDNGIVNDGDGYIEDNEQGKDNKGSASDKKSDIEEDITLSPAPSASPMP